MQNKVSHTLERFDHRGIKLAIESNMKDICVIE